MRFQWVVYLPSRTGEMKPALGFDTYEEAAAWVGPHGALVNEGEQGG